MDSNTTALASSILALAAALGAAVLVALLGVAWRARFWLAGAPSPTASVGAGLLALPRRYLVNVHDVVGRDRSSPLMHMLAAGGLLGTCVLVAIATVVAFVTRSVPTWLAAALALFSLAMVGGGVAARLRRRKLRTERRSLSRGYWRLLGASVGLLGVAIFLEVARQLGASSAGTGPTALDAFAAILALPGLVAIAAVGWGGPLKHAAAGALYLAAHPRPERFSDAISTDLRPQQDRTRFGTGKAADLPWNRILSADACVECGRCEAACPAFAAGMPLNPKRLIRDVLESTGAPVPAYAGLGHPGIQAREKRPAAGSPIVPNFVMPETLWSCTTCRACVEACPMFIEHVDTIVDLRRNVTMELGDVPAKGAAALTELREADEPGGRPLARRFDWAFDLNLPVLAEGGSTDVLLWAGDGAYAARSQASLRALVRLLRQAGVDVAVLGPEERDCGDLARRLGDEITFERIARANIETLSRRKFARIVTADPHALHCLRNEYPAFGGKYEVVHHAAYLLDLIEAGRLPVAPLAKSVTYHDPCYLGRYNKETEPARLLMRRIGIQVTEMKRCGQEARCCGAGGGVALTDMRAERRIADMRMDDACETGASMVAVACPNCMSMLEGTNRLPVVDIVELVGQAAGSAKP